MSKNLSEMTLHELWMLFPVILKEYQEIYKEQFLEEMNSLEHLLGKNIKRINHIGSTAIPGLISKPIIDILLEIEDNGEHVLTKCVENGWLLMSKINIQTFSLNKGYTNNGFAEKIYHLHVRQYGNQPELYFRDYLLENENIAKLYAELKQSLLSRYKHDRDGYTMAKSEFILKYTKIAEQKYGNRYGVKI